MINVCLQIFTFNQDISTSLQCYPSHAPHDGSQEDVKLPTNSHLH